MTTYAKLYTALAERGHRVTSARKQVYSVLASASRPLSNTEIIQHVEGADKVSVYRTLELFESIGIIHRVWNGFKSKVELSDPYSPHHHHFACTSCGKVVSFKSREIEQVLGDLKRSMNIEILTHVVELGGRCGHCKDRD